MFDSLSPVDCYDQTNFLRVGSNSNFTRPIIYHTYIPQPPLSDFVNLFWLYEDYAPPHALERLLPTGTMELVINLREDTLRVYGRQHYDQFQSFCGCLIAGVCIRSLLSSIQPARLRL